MDSPNHGLLSIAAQMSVQDQQKGCNGPQLDPFDKNGSRVLKIDSLDLQFMQTNLNHISFLNTQIIIINPYFC